MDDERLRLRAKFLGGMIGSALGDAIGELAFRYETPETLRAAIASTGRLFYTDDTAMAIGLAESLIRLGHPDPQHIGDTFRANYDREPWRGYAAGPSTIFAHVAQYGGSYAVAAQMLFGGLGSFGNGAAMRIAPIGLFFYRMADLAAGGSTAGIPALREGVRLSAIVTHTHPVGIDGAAVLAYAIGRAATMDPGRPFSQAAFLEELLTVAQTAEMQAQLALLGRLLEGEEVLPLFVGLKLGQGIAAHESVPFALYAFLKHSHSYEACLFCAALHSADRDTVGAMAGALSGAYLGISAIDPGWQEKLENLEYIERLALGLWEKSGEDRPEVQGVPVSDAGP